MFHVIRREKSRFRNGLFDFGSVKSPARPLTRPTFSQRLMFQGTPGVSVMWPAVLYPAPLSHYEIPSARKPDDEAPKPTEAAKDGGGKATAVRRRTSSASLFGQDDRPCFLYSQNKKRRSRGKAKKPSVEEGGRDDEDNGETAAALAPHKTGSEGKASAVSLYPSWKRNTSDSEFSDSEGSAQSKLR